MVRADDRPGGSGDKPLITSQNTFLRYMDHSYDEGVRDLAAAIRCDPHFREAILHEGDVVRGLRMWKLRHDAHPP